MVADNRFRRKTRRPVNALQTLAAGRPPRTPQGDPAPHRFLGENVTAGCDTPKT